MRKAFVGLSGPLFYDYQNFAPATQHDRASSPNPMYDSPASLVLLYDEVWFLCRSLCPASMRDLPFVRYVLEDSETLEKMQDFFYNEDADQDFLRELNRYVTRREFFDNYDANIFALGAKWWRTEKSAIDNHSHGLNLPINGINGPFAANSTDVRCLLLDQAIVNHLGSKYELVTNAFMQEVITPMDVNGQFSPSLSNDIPLVDSIVLHDLPTRLTTKGPDVNFLGELRENGCLSDFRKWIAQYRSRVTPNELRDIESDVFNAIEKHKDSYYKKHDPSEFSKSVNKTILTEGIGLIIPGFTKIMKLAKGLREYHEISNGRWSAFIGNARRAAEKRQ